MSLSKFRIEVPQGRAIFGRVLMDGQELKGVTRVTFDTGESVDGFVSVTVTMFVDDIEIEGEAEPVLIRKPWKQS